MCSNSDTPRRAANPNYDKDTLFKVMSSIRMRDEDMDIEEEDMRYCVRRFVQACNDIQPTAAMDDERTEYAAPIVTLLTVKEAIAVWTPADRQELYEHLNRVYQVRMR
jgi:hypothetical protein